MGRMTSMKATARRDSISPARPNDRQSSVPSIRVRRFSDPSEYMSALRWTSAEIVVAKPGRFSSKLTSIALSGILASRYTETLPRVLRSYHAPSRALIGFTTGPGPAVFAGASELPPNSIFRFGEADSSFHRSTGRVEFATVSLPLEDMEALGSTFGGSDFMPPRDSVVVTPNAAAIARLQKVHAAAGELAEQAPNVIAVPEAAHGLAQALLAAMAACLVTQNGDHRETGNQHRKAIMNRFYRMLEAHPDGVLHALEICKAIGVSRRTLTTCCNETLGMSPHRYLKLRQLHLVRRALRQADPLVATITTVATEHGFWDLGRFASAYRRLFGELPSETLHLGAKAASSAWEHENFTLASKIT